MIFFRNHHIFKAGFGTTLMPHVPWQVRISKRERSTMGGPDVMDADDGRIVNLKVKLPRIIEEK